MNQKRSQIPAPKKEARGSNPVSSDSKPLQQRHHVNRPLCRTSEYKPPGSSTVGLGKENQPSKVVWELQYGLSPTQFELLSKRFPGVAFVQVGFDSHDHPIAHTSYRIVWENVMRSLQPGWKVADVSGNPSYNEGFNKQQVRRKTPITVDTFCKVVSTKDSVRAKVRWGPQVAVDGTRRWEEMTLYDMYRNEENRKRFAEYDCFTFNHVLYYYTMGEVTQLLNLNKNSVAMATIHKLPGRKGSINCGEQEYEKDPLTGYVKQWNVDTGEDYTHPDPAPWFKNFAYADANGAIAWTINKGCDDTYRVTITSTDPRLVPEHCWHEGRIVFRNDDEEVVQVDPVPVVEDPPPAYPVEVVSFKTRNLLPNSIVDKQVDITITHPDLYVTLKSYMINKPRTHRTLQDLTAKAHREVGNNTLIGGRVKIKIDDVSLTRHIFAAWMHGTGLEEELFSVVATSGSVSSVNRNLSGKSLSVGPGNALKQAFKYALTVSTVARSKDPVHQVLTQIDELL